MALLLVPCRPIPSPTWCSACARTSVSHGFEKAPYPPLVNIDHQMPSFPPFNADFLSEIRPRAMPGTGRAQMVPEHRNASLGEMGVTARKGRLPQTPWSARKKRQRLAWGSGGRRVESCHPDQYLRACSREAVRPFCCGYATETHGHWVVGGDGVDSVDIARGASDRDPLQCADEEW